MSSFKAEMRVIRLWLGLCPRPLPDTLAGFKGPTYKGKERRKDGKEG